MAERYLVAGSLRLDTVDERVLRDAAPLRIGGKAFILLRALMEDAQTLVTKDALFDRVWNGLAVSESVLTTAIKELRQALGDDARQPRIIETVHRRGYRFLLPVEAMASLEPMDVVDVVAPPSPPPAAPPPVPKREAEAAAAGKPWFLSWAALIALAASALALLAAIAVSRDPGLNIVAPLAHPKSIAVLPFRDLSPAPNQTWFASGLTEEVLSRLVRTPDLRVASSVSGQQLRTSSGSITDAAERLGVAHILDGSVRRADGRVRVTAQLVRTSDGLQLWSQSYDRPAREIISIQEDIAFRIASALKTVMEPARLRAMVATGTSSVEAYEAYLQGVAADQRSNDTGGRSHAEAAAAAYQLARTLDPDFAEAHWRSAQTWFGQTTRINGSVNGEGKPEALRLAEFLARVDRAIATSQDDIQSLRYQSAKAAAQFELARALELMLRYIRARPRDIDAWEEVAERAAHAGRRDWMADAAQQIHALSLEAGSPRSRAITLSVMALRLDMATDQARKQISLRPNSAMIHYQAHRALIWSGKNEEARRSLDVIEASELPPMTKLLARLRQTCAEDRRKDALAIYDRIRATSTHTSDLWLGAQTIGDNAAAKMILDPLDRPGQLTTLVQFTINPSFDRRLYPQLDAALAKGGVKPVRVVRIPATCPTRPAAS
jgi:TolB-like protein/DNA-binding winged helix-turn-helix (wHTH) protein